MSELFSNLMKDIPFEQMSPHSIRALCEAGMKNIDAGAARVRRSGLEVLDQSILAEINNLSPSYVPAMWRLIACYGATDYWKQHSKDKLCVLALLDLYVKESDTDGNNNYSSSFSSEDIDSSVINDKDVINFILDRQATFIKRFPDNKSIFNSITRESLIALFREDSLLACRVIASNPSLLKKIVPTHNLTENAGLGTPLSTDEMRKMLMCVVDQLGIFNNDSPSILQSLYYSKESYGKELFNDIFMYLCQTCNKETSNMNLISQDMNRSSTGAKARRNAAQGWIRTYLEDECKEGNGRFVLQIVTTLPVMFNLLNCHIQNSAKFRSLKRMYQLSGDIRK